MHIFKASPGPCCALNVYEHDYWRGQINFYQGRPKFVGRWWNNKISSWKIQGGKQCRAKFYKRRRFRGRHFRACTDGETMPGHWHDKTTSLKVYASSRPQCCGLTLFHHDHGKGGGSYFSHSAKYVGNWLNDRASSWQLRGENCKVIMYKHGNFRGSSTASCHGNKWPGHSWNDKISSFKLYPQQSRCAQTRRRRSRRRRNRRRRTRRRRRRRRKWR